jgi:hypothetical protein
MTGRIINFNKFAERHSPKWFMSFAMRTKFLGTAYMLIWCLYSIVYFSYWGSVFTIAASDWVISASSKPWFAFVAIVLAYLLYLLRLHAQCVYALLEIVIGLAAMWSSILTPTNSSLAHLIAVFGGIYIIIRGLDNFEKGLPNLLNWLPKRHANAVQKFWQFFTGRPARVPLETGLLRSEPRA